MPRALWIAARVAAHPAAPARTLATLADAHNWAVQVALATRPDLPEPIAHRVASSSLHAALRMLRHPQTTARQAAALLPHLSPAARITDLPHLPDPDGVLAEALLSWYAGTATWAHILTSPDQRPDLRRAAALRVASARTRTPAQVRQLAAVWHTDPLARPGLRDAASPEVSRVLADLDALENTPLDTLAVGTSGWLSHPANTANAIIAALDANRSGALWDRAAYYARDTDHQVAAWMTRAPLVSDRALIRIAQDTTRPRQLHQDAVAAIARAHPTGAVPDDFDFLCEGLLPGASASFADAVAAVCPSTVAADLLTSRPDTTPERLQSLAASPALGRHGDVLLALHPAADPDQRATATAHLARRASGQDCEHQWAAPQPARGTRVDKWSTAAPGHDDPGWDAAAVRAARALADGAPLTALAQLPVNFADRAPNATTGAVDALADHALGPIAAACTPEMAHALLALEPTFTGTVAELLTTCRAVAH